MAVRRSSMSLILLSLKTTRNRVKPSLPTTCCTAKSSRVTSSKVDATAARTDAAASFSSSAVGSTPSRYATTTELAAGFALPTTAESGGIATGVPSGPATVAAKPPLPAAAVIASRREPMSPTLPSANMTLKRTMPPSPTAGCTVKSLPRTSSKVDRTSARIRSVMLLSCSGVALSPSMR